MGLPFLGRPITLHSSRHAMCELTPEQCAWKARTWLNWYEADHYFGYATVYFVIVLVVIFALANLVHRLHLRQRSKETRQATPSKPLSWIFAVARYASYRVFAIKKIGWYSPAIGVIFIGVAAWVFFGILTLGPKPYYWPNTEEVSYGNSPPIATRTGWMAIALLPFNVACAAKWNFITILTGISHEKLQVFHRWSGWLMFILALIHTFPFIVYHIQQGDMMATYAEDIYYWTGIAALIPQAWLTFMSIGYIRNLFYETFKAVHYVAAAMFIVFFFLHCDFTLTSADYFIGLVIVYGLSLLASAIQTYVLSGFKHRASLMTHSDGTFRVSIPTHISWNPGQHIFVRFFSSALGGANALTNHPFSICSLPSDDKSAPNEILFHIRPHSGITQALSTFAKEHPDESIPVLLEGPYGGVDKEALAGFERYLLIAGGSGSGSLLPVLETLMRRASRMPPKDEEGAAGPATRLDVRVVCVVRHRDSVAWFKEAVAKIVPRSFPGSLRISIYITDSTQATEPKTELDAKTGGADDVVEISDYSSSSSSDRNEYFSIFKSGGRPNLSAIIKDATGEDSSPLAITVCGPASMLFDVRNASADAQVPILAGKSNAASDVWLHTENFSW